MKIESTIENCCYCWLPIGGRITLAKLVLESMSVYWMTVANVPKGILKLIRQKIFHFIWVGAQDNRKVHLANWELLSLPKHSGG